MLKEKLAWLAITGFATILVTVVLLYLIGP